MLQTAEKHLGRKVRSALEMACGPAYHCREMAKCGVVSDGVDLSPEMVEFACELISKDVAKGKTTEISGGNANVDVQEPTAANVYVGDMRRWHAPRKYDLAYCLLVSFAHLLTNEDIVAHFNCVADLLDSDGIYIISHAHPRDFYGSGEPSVDRTWTCERDGIVVETDWGGEDQRFDAIREIDELTIRYTVTADGNTEQFESRERLRRLSYQTFLALLKVSGRFEVVSMLGDFDLDLPLEHEDAVRMVAVLRKL